MYAFQVIVLLTGYAAASGLVSSQRAVIHHMPHHGYGAGVSSRYFDKAEYGLGQGIYGLGYGKGYHGAGYLGGYGAGYLGGYGAGYLGGYGSGYLGGYGGNAYDGIDNLGLAYNNYDLADGRLGLGYGYGLGGLGLGYY